MFRIEVSLLDALLWRKEPFGPLAALSKVPEIRQQ
jgi:hypothetical protein